MNQEPEQVSQDSGQVSQEPEQAGLVKAESDLVSALTALLANPEGREHPGLFITFEGGDGSGKTTLLSKLGELLAGEGVPSFVTREPGGTRLGQQLRQLVQHGPEDVDPRTEALLYAADRAYHAANVLRPSLDGGTVVLEDRYTDSSAAYQGSARQLGADEIRGLSNWATQHLMPDITVLFDVDPQVGLTRAGSQPDRLERSGLAFHQRVRQAYLDMAAQEPNRFVVVDASGSQDQVYELLIRALTSRACQLLGEDTSQLLRED